MFKDRFDAGFRLANALNSYKEKANSIVLGLPRGGVVTAYVVANALHLPLEVVMVKKLGHPGNPEYAIGVVSLTGRVIDGHTGVSQEYIDEETRNIQSLLRKRYAMYHGDKEPVSLYDKTVIVVDDGVATGRTLIAALELIQNEAPKEVVVAVPVGPKDTMRRLKEYADKVICLESYSDFYAIGVYYENFDQVSDEDVIRLLQSKEVNHPGG